MKVGFQLLVMPKANILLLGACLVLLAALWS